MPSSGEDTAAADRRAAMISIYNQSHGIGDRAMTLLPEAYRPIPLEQALDILAKDDSHHAASNRALGLANLAASGVHHVHHHRDLLNDFYHEHRHASGAGGTPQALHELVPPDTAKTDARNLVHLMLAVPDKAKTRNRKLDVWYDSRRQMTKTEMNLEVHDSLNDLALMCDPRSWSQCSDLFASSYEVEAANGWGLGAPPPKPTSMLGMSWAGLFYEGFELSFNSFVSNVFDNILYCDYEVPRDEQGNAESILLTYRIKRAICSKDLWLTRQGGIDIDFGMLSAEETSDGWLKVKATKNVRFTPLDSGHPNFELPRMFVDIQNTMVPSLMAYWAEDWVEKSVGCKVDPRRIESPTSRTSDAHEQGAFHG
jgi:hypothetical protein